MIASALPRLRNSPLLWLPVLGLLGALSYPLFFAQLDRRDLWSSHEGRAAQDAQSILDDGCWALPRLFDRHLELQKPPLYYWLVALSARLRGVEVDNWAVRLPAALAALGSVLGLFILCWLLNRPVAGLCAALILATANHYTWLARVGRIDLPLTFAVGSCLAAYYLASHADLRAGRSKLLLLLAAYGAAAVAVLLKGPVGLVLPAAVVVAHLGLEHPYTLCWQQRSLRPLARQLGLAWGIPLFLLLTVPWYTWVACHTDGSFFRTFLLHHNWERAVGGGSLRAHPWWFYFPRLLMDFLPWSPLLVVAIVGCLRSAALRRDPECRFGLVWLAAIFVVLSLARFKRADYLAPAYPGAALALGCLGERCWRRCLQPRQAGAAFALVVLGVAAAWPVYLNQVLPREELAREQERFAAEVRRWAPRPQLVLFFRVEAHALAFHIGSPIDTFLEWENLDIWVGCPGPHYVVMPVDCLAEASRHLTAGYLEEVIRSNDLPGASHHSRPLVFVRTHAFDRVPPHD